MATMNKDFKIKSGLIVEGTSATVNGNQVLTENAGDQYILDLIGGETLVKSVSGNLAVDGAGDLSINETGLADSLTADSNYLYDDGSGNIMLDSEGVYDDFIAGGVATTTNISDAISTEVTNRNDAIATAKGEAEDYADTVSGNAYTDATQYTDAAITNLNLGTTYDAYGAAATAESNANTYTDNKIVDSSNATDKVWSAYKTSTEIGLAQAAAEDYTDTAVANVVGAAPELLDTLNELAAALQDNPDIISDLQDVAAGKQDTLTAGSNIDITGSTISVTGLDSADISDFNTAALSATASAYDAAGSASTAQTAAEDYADGLAVNYDASGAAATALQDAKDYTDTEINALTTDEIEEGLTNQYFLDSRAKTSAADLLTGATLTNITITGSGTGLTITAENGVADSNTDQLSEGSTNLYFTDSRAVSAISGANIAPETLDITWVRREEATWTGVANASKATVHSFGTNKGSVKYLVRVISGPNSHVTEILATTDSNNNVAVVEYGTIYTSLDPLATATVEWNAVTSQYDLNVTTVQNNSEVLVAATLLAYND
jgi:hypothetical protein